MTLSFGSRVGPYEVTAELGKGGMGKVYRARDPRVGREVAIKIADEQFSDRFGQEARAIAALNHPGIAHLYDVGPNYLVMELVEGPTLAERIAQGPIPFDEAIDIARQIADALEAAHEKGIVHRDLKPGNVKITPEGKVKVLDFGLAKLGGTPVVQSDLSPTILEAPTQAGVILGTAAYMSPEQAKGKPVDKRADIWAFGVVLYEMLTGRRLFNGETVTETLAAVLEREPKWEAVPAMARPLLRRCLEKDPKKRLRDIGEAMAWVEQGTGPVEAQPTQTVTMRRKPGWLWPAVSAGALALAAAAAVVWAPWRPANAGVPVRFEVSPSEKMRFFTGAAMAVSPDGHWMVFPATGEDGVAHYWVRSLDTVEARPLPGTDAAYVPAAWSGDSRYILFTTDQKLRKVDIQGGPVQFVADLPGFLNGAASNKDGVIVLGIAPNNGRWPLLRVPAGGGAPTPITALAKGENRHAFPQFLPDGRHFLYLRVSADPNQMGIYIGSIDAKPEQQSLKRLLASNRQAYYAAAPGGGKGYLIFLRETTLMAQPFDARRMELSGEPQPIAESLDSFPIANYALFSVSDTGALVYRTRSTDKLVLTWFDQSGNAAGSVGEPGVYADPAISPDGTRVAAALELNGARDLWILDTVRGTSTRFTFDSSNNSNPVWSPDGKSIAFSSARSGQTKMYVKPADGSSEERLLSDHEGAPTDWSRDGKFLLFTSSSPGTSGDIWLLPEPGRPSATARPVPILATKFNEGQARFSPDGRWIAYASLESGSAEVYVRPFSPDAAAASGAKWLISKGGGVLPRWRADGKQLFYEGYANPNVLAADIDTSHGFQAGTPRRLFTTASLANDDWDLAPDGKRFLFLTSGNGGRATPFTVVLNWQAGLKK